MGAIRRVQLSTAMRPDCAESDVPLSESMNCNAWSTLAEAAFSSTKSGDSKEFRRAVEINVNALGFKEEGLFWGEGFHALRGGGRWRDIRERSTRR